VLPGNRTDFLELPERNTDNYGASLWPVDDLGWWILGRQAASYNNRKESSRKDLRHGCPWVIQICEIKLAAISASAETAEGPVE
jgi:hypothetical protein